MTESALVLQCGHHWCLTPSDSGPLERDWSPVTRCWVQGVWQEKTELVLLPNPETEACQRFSNPKRSGHAILEIDLCAKARLPSNTLSQTALFRRAKLGVALLALELDTTRHACGKECGEVASAVFECPAARQSFINTGQAWALRLWHRHPCQTPWTLDPCPASIKLRH